jgi:putative metallopeptidase DUF4344
MTRRAKLPFGGGTINVRTLRKIPKPSLANSQNRTEQLNQGLRPMQRVISAAAIAFATISPTAHAEPASASRSSLAANSQVEIRYVQPSNRAYQPIYDGLKKRQALEELQLFLAPLRLPQKLTVQVDQCGATSRSRQPQDPVTICYELVDKIEKVAAQADPKLRSTMVAGTFIQVVLYEVAQGVLDILDTPLWGRRGDAADRLAALVMVRFGEDFALRTITATTNFFHASRRTWTGSDFADVTSPEEQRYYNYLCIAYGGAPQSFDFLVNVPKDQQQILPHARAVRCEGEYRQIQHAFDLRIMPFVDADLVVTVRSMDWLLASDIK